RWRLQRMRGELSDAVLASALRGVTVGEVFDRFAERFFVDAQEARKRAQAIEQNQPRLAERTKHSADQSVRHVFDLLGSGPVQLGERIDWHTDFKTGISFARDGLEEEHDSLRPGEP